MVGIGYSRMRSTLKVLDRDAYHPALVSCK